MPTVTHIIDNNLPVYATGDQTINGAKIIPQLFTRLGSVPKNPSFVLIGDPTTGTRHFIPFSSSSQDQQALSNFINSQTWNIRGRVGFTGPYIYLASGLINTTGFIDIPIASGNNFSYEFTTLNVENKLQKIEKSGVFALLPNEKIGIGTFEPLEKLHIFGNLKVDGGGSFISRPTVNGTGVLLQGEAAETSLQNVVFATGDQTISGTKTFDLRPTVNVTGVILSGEAVSSNGTINTMVKLTQAQYNALLLKDPTTFYVIVD